MNPIRSACLGVLLVGLLAGPSLPAQSPGPPLAPDHWSYELLDALDAAGVADAWMSDFRPIGRSTVRGELDRVVRGGFGASELGASWVARFDGRNPVGAPGRDGADYEVRAEAGSRHGDALFDPGAGLRAVGGGAARLGPLALWLEAGEAGRERADDLLRTGGVSLPLGPFHAMVGRMGLKAAGPAPTSAQLGGRLPMDAAYLVTPDRAPLPGLGWLFGPAAWHFGLTPLERAGEWGEGWIGLGGAVAQPGEDFRIGAVRTARFGGDEVPGTTLPRLLRTTFLIQNEPTSWDDQKNELTFRYRWTVGEQPMAAHAVLGMEDAPYWRDPAILSGVTVPFLRSSGMWVLRYTYEAYGGRARWCPVCDWDVFTPGGAFDRASWYDHAAHGLYARDGLPLAAPLGGYGASHTARLRFWDAGARFRLEAWSFFQVREEGNLFYDRWPGKRRGGGVGLLWFPAPGVEVEGRVLAADGPEMEREAGLEATVSWVTGGGGGEPAAARGTARSGPPAGTRELTPGVRVEVSSPRFLTRKARGTLLAVDDEALRIRVDGGPGARRIPLSTVERVRTRAGSHPATLRGAFLGAAAGLVGAIAYDEATGARDEQDVLADPRWGLRAGIIAGGTGLGALIGSRFDVEEWSDVAPR